MAQCLRRFFCVEGSVFEAQVASESVAPNSQADSGDVLQKVAERLMHLSFFKEKRVSGPSTQQSQQHLRRVVFHLGLQWLVTMLRSTEYYKMISCFWAIVFYMRNVMLRVQPL